MNKNNDALNDHITVYQLEGHEVQALPDELHRRANEVLQDVTPLKCTRPPIDMCNDLFAEAEVALARRDLKKGVGSVGINNEMIRKVTSSNLDMGLTMLFNAIWLL